MNETFFFWFWLIFLLPFQVTSRQAVLSMLDTTRQRASDREVIYDNEMNTTWLNEEAQSDAEHRELSVCLPTFTKPFERTESFRRADYAEDSDSKKCTWIFFRLEASIRYARYYIFLFPFAWPAAHARNLYKYTQTDTHWWWYATLSILIFRLWFHRSLALCLSLCLILCYYTWARVDTN